MHWPAMNTWHRTIFDSSSERMNATRSVMKKKALVQLYKGKINQARYEAIVKNLASMLAANVNNGLTTTP